MKLLDRYLYRLFVKNLLLVLLALAGIYLLIDFFERIDNFMTQGLPVTLALRYFLLKIPQIVDQIMPVTIMLAGIVTIGLLNHHGELASLQASGTSIERVIRPVILASLFFSCLSLASSQWILPMTGRATNKIWHEDVSRQTATGITRAGMVFYRGAEGFYLFGPPRGDNRTFSPFTYLAWDAGFGFSKLLTAKTATREENRWQLKNGLQKHRTKDGGVMVEPFTEFAASLPENPSALFLPEYHDAFLSLSALARQAKKGDDATRRGAAMRLHGRLSYILLGLPLLLIGLPGLLYLSRQWRRDLSLAIPAGCLLAFAVWGAWGTMQSLASAGYLSVLPAAWGLHLLVGGAGGWLLRKSV